MAFLELKIPPVIVVGMAVLGMWGVAQCWPQMSFSFMGVQIVGISLFAVGALFAALGLLEFIKAKTTADPRYPDKASQLVITGVYRFSRNPMYFGLFLIQASWAFYLGNIVALLLLPIFVVFMNRFQIQPEERYMAQKFGQEYTSYTSKVRRWI